MRTTNGSTRNKAKKKLFQKVEGYVGGRRKLLRTAKETLLRSGNFAFRDRRVRKRDFRRLWITRLTAACRQNDLSYSRFIHGLNQAGIELNRKTLSEMAIHDPEAFAQVVVAVKDALAAKAA